MRNVTTVVPVLITNCQVSLYPKIGPVTAQMTTIATAIRNVVGFPEIRAVASASRPNQSPDFDVATYCLLEDWRACGGLVGENLISGRLHVSG